MHNKTYSTISYSSVFPNNNIISLSSSGITIKPECGSFNPLHLPTHYHNSYYQPNQSQLNENEYEKHILGKFKEGNKMIESLEIIKMYKANREAYINNKYNKKLEELKSKNTISKEFEELVNSFKAAVEQLYTSQFKEGQTESTVALNSLALINNGGATILPFKINENFYPEGAKELEDAKRAELEDLIELCAKVTAVLKICKTKQEVEEELVKYSIYNKKKELDLIKIENN